MFSKLLIWAFSFLACYSILMLTIPTVYLVQAWNPTHADPEIAQKYDMWNITQYSTASAFDIEFPEEKTFSMGLPAGQELSFHWDNHLIPYMPLTIEPLATFATAKTFVIKHLTDKFLFWWYGLHYLEFDIGAMEEYIFKGTLEDRWSDDLNASIFNAECEHIRLNVAFEPFNSSWTIGEAWDNNHLNITTSWEVDLNATHMSAWNVMAQLLLFQSPNLGISGYGGLILNFLIATPFYVAVAICIIQLAQSVIPLIRGLPQ